MCDSVVPMAKRYAETLRYVEVNAAPDPKDMVRLEEIRICETGEQAIRLSWWRGGRYMVPAPVLSAGELRELIRLGTEAGII